MPSETSSIKLYSFISSFIREVSNVREPEKLLSSLVRTIQRIVGSEEVLITDEKMHAVYASKNNVTLGEEEKNMILWSVQKMTVSAIPIQDKIFLVAPLSKSDRTLGALVIALSQEPSFEIFELVKLFAFLSTVILENLKLYESLERQHQVVEETMKYMQQIFNSFPQMIVVLDEVLNPVFANIRYVENENNEELINQIKQVAVRTFTLNEKQSQEVEIKGIFYSIIAEPIEYEGQRQVLVTITDVTNTKELERLKQIDALKTEFIANVSHELRTPLAAIRAYVETILNSLDELNKTMLKDFMKTVFDETLHLENLVNQILDFAKIEQKTLKLEKTWFDLVELCQEVIQSMGEFAKSKQVSLEYEGPDQLIVFADRMRLRQVLMNLVSNGIKYSNPENRYKYVKIKLERLNDSVIIAVSDNGIGIPKEYQSRIFEKFFRVQSFKDYKVEGTGLGLTICKEIVELHGGKIWFESEPGKGSIFYVKLNIGE
ncbi:sensor histidine kinase [Pseudothermotoga thermarum]|uniref:histidine kinase n=1 Tax=Pseudothermotoga thermarum DSM 5069 TaxID=688269 RepID=F7YYL5_9THEM|nr:HAMP domain-containing sensor histidine kinase [Pseudothermotoga thermarum]AEH51047.1 histidine kinase [Pseudothermotoga thermarum DSM 5069]